jgi:guanosine-3',5'-bis(diphosphate) 3'-pyrophosphohydrolase
MSQPANPSPRKPETAPWARAAAFAARAHQGRTRKDGRTPYYSHVVRVSLILLHEFECNDPVALTAALLHDTIEDTDTDYDDIAEEFGEAVADCVVALSKNALLPHDRREREYDEGLARASRQARLVKLADVYDNLSDSVNNPAWPSTVNSRINKALRALRLAEDDPQADLAREKVRQLIHRFQSALGETV